MRSCSYRHKAREYLSVFPPFRYLWDSPFFFFISVSRTELISLAVISIPDIEAHIQSELSQSPSPTSRRVGVPLPVKTRPGVAIPQTHQRSRRQVQIFHSQPLSSPKSGGRVHNRLDNSSGSTSLSSSYIAQMHMSRMGSILNGSPGTSITKVPSALASSLEENFSVGQQKIAQAFASKGMMVVPTKDTNSPSTSSSSSSISSTMASTTAVSSSLNTPPTSQSISNLREFIGAAPLESELRTGPKISPVEVRISEDERKGLAIPFKKVHSKINLQSELCSAMSSSWKEYIPSSSRSLGSPGLTGKNGHLLPRSRSGLSNTNFWKDPGTGVPAPAVLVSAVVGADGLDDDLTKVSLVDVQTMNVVQSETSSATTTVVRPSPVGTPLPMSAKFSNTLPSDDLPQASNSDPFCDIDMTATNGSHRNDQPTTSLLSQTAPRLISTSERPTIRNSPPQQVSQLSAHMHLNKSSLPCSCLDASHNHSSRMRSGTKSRAARVVESSVTDSVSQPHPVLSSVVLKPSAPPSTPIDASSTMSYTVSESLSRDISDQVLDPRKLPLLYTSLDDSMHPPISVKIADLGNATPSKKHFTEDIQTRQYRAPEAILGRRDWDTHVDIWSVACVVSRLEISLRSKLMHSDLRTPHC